MLQFSLMSSADLDVLNFGDRIFVVVFYRQAQWKKIKTNIQNSKFDTSKLMSCRRLKVSLLKESSSRTLALSKITFVYMQQGCNWRVGKVGNCPPKS
jgi:hypothetical protein